MYLCCVLLISSQRSNYALREEALALKDPKKNNTMVITNGANPGMVSYMVKEALINIAKDTNHNMKDEPGIVFEFYMSFCFVCIHVFNDIYRYS